jgi:fructokinase
VSREPIEILVAGEALIDLVERSCSGQTAFFPSPGGSPMNVAIGLARLGVPTGFLARLSRDAFGELLLHHLEENGVAMDYILRGGGSSTLAFAVERRGEEPEYAFYAEAAADRQIAPSDLPTGLPKTLRTIHVGSYALAVEPIGSTLTALIDRETDRLISLDPNVRPSLIGEPEAYRRRLEGWIARSDVVKMSRSDAAWVWPGADPEALACGWIEAGRALVVLTGGSEPVVGRTVSGRAEIDVPSVDIVDTVGAGDAFTAGLLCRLRENGLLGGAALNRMSEAQLHDALSFAAAVAATTCARRGADPPTRDQFDSR